MLEAEADQLEDELIIRGRVFEVGEDALLELAQREV